MTDILEIVAGYAPVETSAEWDAARQDGVLLDILSRPAQGVPAVEIPLQVAASARRRRRHRATTLAASAAALTAAASAVVAIAWPGAQSGPVLAAGAAWDPPSGLSDNAPIHSGKYGYDVIQYARVDTTGAVIRAGRPECSTDRTGRGNSFETPSKAFLARLPTDIDALEKYLRSHVQGSSSLDEAVFVAVGDALRTSNALASPRLKAALLAVLSRTGGVVLHEGVHDHLGRPAIRADFVNQAIRPDDVQALYFDPTTFALLEQGDDLPNGQPTTYDGPSPAYTAHASPGVDPDQLPGPGYVTLIRHSAVADSRAHCPK